MFFEERVYTLAERGDPHDLATDLTEYTWCRCNGFEHGEYLYLNDSTGSDGAQEYAVIRILNDRRDESGTGPVVGRLVESLTVSWMNFGQLYATIREIDGWGVTHRTGLVDRTVVVRVEGAGHRCYFCA